MIPLIHVAMVKCDGCDGCGYVADNYERTPWTLYTLPLSTVDGESIADSAKRVYCDKCKGTGRIPGWRRSLYRPKKDKG